MSGWPEPVWLSQSVVVAIHGEQLTVHGGAEGLRDAGLLASALARPMNPMAYAGADIPALAAACAIAIARNRPFIDGNKRTAFVCLEASLLLNGWTFPAPDAEAVVRRLELAGGSVSDEAFSAWVLQHAGAKA